jgi:nitric oxide dioxygenase
MTDRQILIIKASWSAAMVRSQETGDLFYQKLFELAPALLPLFCNDRELQVRKFTSIMTVLIRSIQYTDQLVTELEELALRHTQYGAKPEDYPVTGTALLWALQQQLGDQWDAETEEAWTELHLIMLRVMIPVVSPRN